MFHLISSSIVALTLHSLKRGYSRLRSKFTPTKIFLAEILSRMVYTDAIKQNPRHLLNPYYIQVYFLNLGIIAVYLGHIDRFCSITLLTNTL